MAPQHDAHSLVLIDGRSGAGKTSFATQLARARSALLISIDDAYPGWDGLDAGSWHIYSRVLVPWSRGEQGSYQTWDWKRARPGEWVQVPSDTPLVVEGCGAIRRESSPLATRALWLEAPEAKRRQRVAARDGDTCVPHWHRWSLQEQRFGERHRPRDLATEVVLAGRSQAGVGGAG